MGTVNGSFTTTYGALNRDPWMVGAGSTLAATVNATPRSYTTYGALAGPDPGGVLTAVVGARTDGTIDIVLLLVDPTLYLPGATVPVDWGSALGIMQNYNPSTSTTTLVGFIFNGSVHFDQAGATAGAPVSGTFQGELLIPPP